MCWCYIFYSLATESNLFEKGGVVLKRTVFSSFSFLLFFFWGFFSKSFLVSSTSHTSLAMMVFKWRGRWLLDLHVHLHLNSGHNILHYYRRRNPLPCPLVQVTTPPRPRPRRTTITMAGVLLPLRIPVITPLPIPDRATLLLLLALLASPKGFTFSPGSPNLRSGHPLL